MTTDLTLIVTAHNETVVSGPTMRAADMLHRILFGVLDQHIQFYDRPPGVRAFSSEEIVDEITRACLGYLGAK